MSPSEFHLSDRELLMALDGELPPANAQRAKAHLAACWSCRVRAQEIETAIGEFVHCQRQDFERRIPPPGAPRAMLKARLSQLSETGPPEGRLGAHWALVAAAVVLLAAATFFATRSLSQRHVAHAAAVSVPDPILTPGATVLIRQSDVCRATNANNKAVPVALEQRVFDEYGIRYPAPRAYEVDYLITPALGGADDIHNLWPQSSRETLWNAQVKDELEERLRDLVCDGQLDLPTAQHDIATNWIAAYKKYFHTDHPLAGSPE